MKPPLAEHPLPTPLRTVGLTQSPDKSGFPGKSTPPKPVGDDPLSLTERKARKRT